MTPPGTQPPNPWDLILGRFDDIRKDVVDFRSEVGKDVKDVLQRLARVEQNIKGLMWVVGVGGVIIGNLAPKALDYVRPIKPAQAASVAALRVEPSPSPATDVNP